VSCANTPHVGDLGTILRTQLREEPSLPSGDPFDELAPVPVDLSAATAVTYLFKPPGAPAFRRVAAIVDAAGGLVDYVISGGDLRWFGTWHYQVIVATPVGNWHSTSVEFEVEPNLGPATMYLDATRLEIGLYAPQASVVMS
jgi:hypothetical protein